MAGTTARRTAVRLRAWGESEADLERAVREAEQAPAHRGWEFVAIERLRGATCPLDVRETGGGVIATDAGYGWAYVAVLARGGS